MHKTDELRTARIDSLVTPQELAEKLPISAEIADNVTASRQRIEKILTGEDRRLLVVIGPCSIHDLDAAVDYAGRLNQLRIRYQDRLEIVMRTYFEKPRTVVGWKGLISDPALDGSFQVNRGIEMARRLLLEVNQLGLPTATEFLDMVVGQYIADLISWARLAHGPPKARSTVRWPRRSPARWASKTVPTAIPASPLTPFVLRAPDTCSCPRTNTAR